MAKQPKHPAPTGPWWHPPTDKLEAAGFTYCPVSVGWKWYSAGEETGGYHVWVWLHSTGWIFILNSRLYQQPRLTTVATGPDFTELLGEYGWRPRPK